jgi:ferric-dicitrate binding protein FerR (iron transport regulator)
MWESNNNNRRVGETRTMRDDDDSAARNRRLLERIWRLHKWRSVPAPERRRHTPALTATGIAVGVGLLALMAPLQNRAPSVNVTEERQAMVVGDAAASEVIVGNAIQVTVIEATNGPEKKLLEDGTVVTMPSGAKLGVQFSPQQRKVHLLTKEALFDVAKDPSRPFAVSAGDIVATAVGTRFRVVSGECVQVQVVEGTVRVSVRGDRPDAPTTKLTEGQFLDWPAGCSKSP